jgi:hypothetical protein
MAIHKRVVTKTVEETVRICDVCGKTELTKYSASDCHVCGKEVGYCCGVGIAFYPKFDGRVYANTFTKVCELPLPFARFRSQRGSGFGLH